MGKIAILTGTFFFLTFSAHAAEIQADVARTGPAAELAVGTQVGVMNGGTALGVEARGSLRLPGDEPLYAGLILGLAQWSPYRWNGGNRVTDAATHVHLLGSLSWRGDLWHGLRPRFGLVAGVAWMALRGETRIATGGILPGDTTALPDAGDRRLAFVFGVQPALTLPLESSGVELGFELRAGVYDLDPYLAPGFHVHADL